MSRSQKITPAVWTTGVGPEMLSPGMLDLPTYPLSRQGSMSLCQWGGTFLRHHRMPLAAKHSYTESYIGSLFALALASRSAASRFSRQHQSRRPDHFPCRLHTLAL